MNPVDFILVFSTGFVAFVLLFSGATKLRGRGRTLTSMTALRIPRFARRSWIAASLPICEIALGLGLLIAPGAYRSALAVLAAATFSVFTVFVLGVLLRGEKVNCGCFGPFSGSDSVTGWTAIRNTLLILLSVVVALTASHSSSFVLDVLHSELTVLQTVALAWALIAVGLLLSALLRRGSRPESDSLTNISTYSVEAAGQGAPLPDAELVSQDNVSVPLLALGSGSPVLLVFLSAECTNCAAVALRLEEWQQEIAPIALCVATSSRPDMLRERMPKALPFAYFGALAAKRALGVQGSAAAVLLGGASHPYVASPAVRGEQEIDALVRGIAEARTTYVSN